MFCTPLFAVSSATCFDTDTTLMAHMNGTDGSTTFTDSSTGGVDSPHTITANGNAQIDTGQSQFGGASGQFDGTGDFLTITDSEDWNLGTGDWTFDMWVRDTNVNDNNMIAMQCTNTMCAGGTAKQGIFSDNSNVYVCAWSDGTTHYTALTPTITANAWHHITCTKSGTTLTGFADGVAGTPTTVSSNAAENYTSAFRFGVEEVDNVGFVDFNGWMDEVRFVKGTAVWTTNFTSPSAEYTAGPCQAGKNRALLGVGE